MLSGGEAEEAGLNLKLALLRKRSEYLTSRDLFQTFSLFLQKWQSVAMIVY